MLSIRTSYLDKERSRSHRQEQDGKLYHYPSVLNRIEPKIASYDGDSYFLPSLSLTFPYFYHVQVNGAGSRA